jgi:hypothetical protein
VTGAAARTWKQHRGTAFAWAGAAGLAASVALTVLAWRRCSGTAEPSALALGLRTFGIIGTMSSTVGCVAGLRGAADRRRLVALAASEGPRWSPDPRALLAGETRAAIYAPLGEGVAWAAKLLTWSGVAAYYATLLFDWSHRTVPAVVPLFAALGVNWILVAVAGRPVAEAHVRFRDAPLRPGTVASIEFALGTPRRPFPPEAFEFTLRCVRETRRCGGLVPSRAEVLASVPPSGQDARLAKSLTQRVVLEFVLPEGLPGSDLLADPAIVWTLDVDASADGRSFRDAFFVPVRA